MPQSEHLSHLNRLLKALRVCGGIAAGTAMVALLTIGLVEILSSTAIFILSYFHMIGNKHTKEEMLHGIFSGLEMLFIAPMIYASFKAVVEYVSTVSGSNGEEIAARSRLHALKAFILGLLITVIATDLTAHALHTAGEPALTVPDAGIRFAAICVFAGYLVVLERAYTGGGARS